MPAHEYGRKPSVNAQPGMHTHEFRRPSLGPQPSMPLQDHGRKNSAPRAASQFAPPSVALPPVPDMALPPTPMAPGGHQRDGALEEIPKTRPVLPKKLSIIPGGAGPFSPRQNTNELPPPPAMALPAAPLPAGGFTRSTSVKVSTDPNSVPTTASNNSRAQGPVPSFSDAPQPFRNTANTYISQASAPPPSISIPLLPTSPPHSVSTIPMKPRPTDQGRPDASRAISPPPTQERKLSSVPLLKVKTHYGTDIFILAIPADCAFSDMVEKVERKIRLSGAPVPENRRMKLKYKDQDGDFISIHGDDDLALAFEAQSSMTDRSVVNICVEYS
jgi:PB1 domain